MLKVTPSTIKFDSGDMWSVVRRVQSHDVQRVKGWSKVGRLSIVMREHELFYHTQIRTMYIA